MRFPRLLRDRKSNVSAVVLSCIAASLALFLTFSIAARAQSGELSGQVDLADSVYGTSNPTIRELVRSARLSISGNELERGALTLERAMRLQPENPVLWYALARLRYRQQGYAEVRSLAARVIALAGSNDRLRGRSQQLDQAALASQQGDAIAIEDLDIMDPSIAVTGSTGVGTGKSSAGIAVGNPGPSSVALPAPPAPVETTVGATTLNTETSDMGSDVSDVGTIRPGGVVLTTPTVSTQATVVVPAPVTTDVNQPAVVQPQASVTPTTTQSTARSGVVTTPVPGSSAPAAVLAPAPTPQMPSTPIQPGTRVIVRAEESENSMIRDRSFSHYGRRSRGVASRYLPPPGLCRIWYDDLPAVRQPPVGDCDTLRREVPRDARLIVGEQRYSWEPFQRAPSQ